VKRQIWAIALIALLALVGCGGKSDDAPAKIVAVEGAEEDAYQTAVFAEQKIKWEALALQGDAPSQRKLGVMYYLGQGMDPDYEMAYSWLGKAADQGEDVAQVFLGVMNVEGQGVPHNKAAAHMWFSLSAQQGNKNARIRLDELVPKMTPEEIAEAETLAENWKPTY
jgi:TPR repeat protein